MGEFWQKPILGAIVCLIIIALLFFDREVLIALAQQSYFIIIALLLVFLYLAIRSKTTSIQEPVYSNKVQFSATVNTINISKSVIRDELHKWIKERRIWVTIILLHEDENSIQIKYPVTFISSGLGAKWTPNPMLIYYISFIYRENQVEVEAEVEYPQPNLSLFSQSKSRNYFGVLKCRDFIFKFFKRLDVSEDVLYKELYSRSELEAYFKEEDKDILRILLLIFGIATTVIFIAGGTIFDIVYASTSSVIVLGVFVFGSTRLQSRKYRHILSHYLKDEDSIRIN